MEKTVKMKAAGIASAAILLAGSGAALTAMPAEATPSPDNGAATAPATADQTAASTTRVSPSAVEGQFLFTQDAVTSTSSVRDVFAKAASALCASLPQYEIAGTASDVVVTGPDGAVLGTIEELASGDEAPVMVGCACASNGPGGGAIANVGVSGTTLAALVAAVSA